MVFLLKWGLRATALAFAVSAVSLLEQGRHGKGLVYAGLCLLYLLLSGLDLGKLWASRHMHVMQVAHANRPSIRFTIGTTISYSLCISGSVLQLFFE